MDQTLLSCLSPFHCMEMAAFSQADLAEVAAKAAIGYIARGLSPPCIAFYRAVSQGSLGPPLPQSSGGKPGGTRVEVWDELL